MSISAEDRMEILQLLSEGRVTVQEASHLMAGNKEGNVTIDEPGLISVTEEDMSPSDSKISSRLSASQESIADRPTWFHVKVSDLKTGKGKVTVNIPISLVRAGFSIGSRFSPEIKGLEWNELATMLTGEKRILVDVEDEEDGEHVQIYVD